MSRCETCWPEEGCSLPPTFLTYSVSEYGDVPGQGPDREKAMMLEIFRRGPISCGICVTDELLEYKGLHMLKCIINKVFEKKYENVNFG